MSDYAQPIERIRHERRAAAQARIRRRRLTRIAVTLVAGVLVLAGGLGFALSNEDDASGQVLLPGVGDHWHALYTVTIDGEDLAIFPASAGDVHSHGDGLVHVHPHSEGTASEAATLSAFFASLGGELTNDSLRLPDGRTFAHDAVRIIVDGDQITGWAGYIPQDGDQIEIVITTATE
jgi:hypothetical protein